MFEDLRSFIVEMTTTNSESTARFGDESTSGAAAGSSEMGSMALMAPEASSSVSAKNLSSSFSSGDAGGTMASQIGMPLVVSHLPRSVWQDRDRGHQM